ncbi:MAG: membrane protein insertase YidC [Planctomycetes bacterium]|nr:membrane protein insertase YidC [Planctomycetota bacterium]
MAGRYILAITLSVIVVLFFQKFVLRPPPRRQEAPAAPKAPPRPDPAPAPDLRQPPEASGLRSMLRWRGDGRDLERIDLEMRRPGPAGDVLSTRAAFLAAPEAPGPLALALRAPRGESGEESGDALVLLEGWDARPAPEGESGELWIHAADHDGLRVTRTVRRAAGEAGQASPGLLSVEIEIENTSPESRALSYEIHGPGGLFSEAEDDPGADLYAAYGLRDEKGKVAARSRAAASLGEEPLVPEGAAAWVGGHNGAILAALWPAGALSIVDEAFIWRMPLIEDADGRRGGFRTALGSAPISVGAGERVSHRYFLYAGPADIGSLAPHDSMDLAGALRVEVDLSPRFRAACDGARGVISELRLLEFKESIDPAADDGGEPPPYRLLGLPREGPGTLSVEIFERDGSDYRALGLADASWSVRVRREDGQPPEVLFESRRADVLVVKRISVAPPDDVLASSDDARQRAAGDPDGRHHLRVVLEVRNLAESPRELFYRLHGPAAIDTEHFRSPGYDLAFSFGTIVGQDRVQSPAAIDAAKLPESRWERGDDIAWVGIANCYFGSIFFPRGDADRPASALVDNGFAERIPDPVKWQALIDERAAAGNRLGAREIADLAEKAYANIRVGFTSEILSLGAKEETRHEYGLFAAPRRKDILQEYDRLSFEGINYYGWVGSLVSLFIFLLETLRTVAFGSWGVAIVLLTLLVKLCLHPINKRSQRSMMRFQKKMQKIKPQMEEIKQKFGGDRMAMNRETQKLWKEHGINPAHQMAGCLIIFLQLPIWIGLYVTLQYALGLRQSSFLYISDLTQPDTLFSWGTKIPMLGASFNLLPLLYVILTVLNQRMQPKPEDPQMRAQYHTMTFMMVFFGVIFYQFPAAFMLYIMTSAGLGIVESKIIKAQLKAEDGEQGSAPAGGDAPAGPAAYPGRSRAAGKGGDAPSPYASRKARKRGKRR